MIDRECKTCGKQFTTEHEYALDCPPCYYAGKKAREKASPAKPEAGDSQMDDNLITVLTRLANSVDRLVLKLGDKA